MFQFLVFLLDTARKYLHEGKNDLLGSEHTVLKDKVDVGSLDRVVTVYIHITLDSHLILFHRVGGVR